VRQEHPDADSITPAEALALLDGARTDGRLAFKLALLDMMAAGLLTLPPDGPATSTSSSAAISRTGARPTVTTANPYVLSTDAAAWARSKRHCTAAVRALSLGGAAGSPYPFRSAALGLRDAHGADASGFVADCLLPDLADAGLLAAERNG